MINQIDPILQSERKENCVYLTLNRPAVLNALNRPLLIALKQELEKIKETPEIQAVIITGAFLPAEAKVLTNENVTTHCEDIPSLRANYPKLTVHETERWVDEGDIVTSGGIASGY